MNTHGLSSPTSAIDLEYKYRVTVDNGVHVVPFRVAVLVAEYPPICLYHHDAPASPLPKSHLCGDCTAALGRYFQLIADEWPNLQDGLARAGRAVSSERAGGTSDPAVGPLPINTDVSEAMGLARAAVWSTVGQLVQDRPDLSLPPDHSTDVLADWVARRHIGYLAAHPSARHLHAVFTDVADAAEAVRDQAYECRPVQVDMRHSHCHQFTEDDTGARIPCPGRLVGVLLPNGSKVVECDVDPSHRIPADAWFQIQNRRAPRPARARNTLRKKYLKAR